MQISNRKNIEKRLLFYWSKLYSQEIKSGNTYNKLKKTIIVLFVDYELDNLTNIPKTLTKWQIREENYTNFVLTNMLEIYILELPKFEKYEDKIKNTELNLWINFIKNPEVINLKNTDNKEIKKAKEILEEISQDERERYLADLREKYILDQNDIKATGFEEGLAQGSKNEKIAIAKKLLKSNIDINIIINSTGLTKEEIENLI